MAVTLGAITLDETRTATRERLEEVAGRDGRIITVSGAIEGTGSVEAIEAALDGIIAAASVADYSAALSIRPGRRLWVRRNAFTREVQAETLVGAFRLELEARDPVEESVEETVAPWTIDQSGATRAVETEGNVHAKPVIALTAVGTVVQPAFSDGARTLSYSGSVGDGETLVVDAAKGTVTLEGVDVTAYTAGEFPRLGPGETTLTYTDGGASSHTASAVISFRDRWW